MVSRESMENTSTDVWVIEDNQTEEITIGSKPG